MFRLTSRDDVAWLAVVVATSGMIGGAINAAVASDPVETVYQWMRGILFGGLMTAIVVWVGRALWPVQRPVKSSGQQ